MTIREDVKRAQHEQDAAEEHADAVMRHIATMYPEVYGAMKRSAKTSIKNTVRSDFLLKLRGLAE